MTRENTVHFGQFVLDRNTLELWRGGERVRIRRKPLELLMYLTAHRDRVVSKNDLREHVWRGVSVSDEALTTALRDLRRALGDGTRAHPLVSTVRGFGYRLAPDAPDAPDALRSRPDNAAPPSGATRRDVQPCSPVFFEERSNALGTSSAPLTLSTCGAPG